MKKIMKKFYSQRAEMLGYKPKKKKDVKEGIHVTSWSPTAQMATVKDPAIFENPSELNGLELDDPVAMATTPTEKLGVLMGITGFRKAIVRTMEGKLIEYDRDAIVAYSPEVEVDEIPGSGSPDEEPG